MKAIWEIKKLEPRIDELVKRVDALEKEVAELKKKPTARVTNKAKTLKGDD
jgi:uncharacterized protein YoxC